MVPHDAQPTTVAVVCTLTNNSTPSSTNSEAAQPTRNLYDGLAAKITGVP